MVLRLGDPRFAIHEDDEEFDPLAPDTLEISLVTGEPPHEFVRTTLVLQFQDSSRSVVAFPTVLRGDTLVAAGNKGDVPSARFTVGEIVNQSDRLLSVRHGNADDSLLPGSASDTFRGTLLGGSWEFRSVLTEAEHANPLIRPTSLRVEVTIACSPGAR